MNYKPFAKNAWKSVESTHKQTSTQSLILNEYTYVVCTPSWIKLSPSVLLPLACIHGCVHELIGTEVTHQTNEPYVMNNY